MSVLDYPRIHFKGQCLISPATGNNNDVTDSVDPVNVRLRPALEAMTDAQVRDRMMSSFKAEHIDNKQEFNYRKGGWNYFGDLTVRIMNAVITAVVDEKGALSTTDPLVSLPIDMLGSPQEDSSTHKPAAVICDLDPMGAALTQLFIGKFLLGDEALGLSATQDFRAFGRWVLWRNAVIHQGEQLYPACGATWQFAIPFNAITFSGAEKSEILGPLSIPKESLKGLVVQFAIYLPRPKYTDAELVASFQQDEFAQNPVICEMVGTVGLWKNHELKTAPADRLLLREYDTVIGPAAALVQRDRDVVSLNLISTFPEADFNINQIKKYDFGNVILGVIKTPGAAPVPISDPIAYDYATYQTRAGIIDVDYKPSAATRAELDAGALVLLFDPDEEPPNRPLISEAGSAVTVDTDDRGVYLEVGEQGAVSILVRERGGPPASSVTVNIYEYQYVLVAEGPLRRARATLTLAGGETGPLRRVDCPGVVTFPAGQTVPLSINVKALNPGTVALAFTLNGAPLPEESRWDDNVYAGVRVLPKDDYSAVINNGPITWEYIYQEFFRYYHLVYPAMSSIIDFSDQAVMEQHAQHLVALTDPNLRMSTRYMPPSRELSAGKRALLVAWANGLSQSSSAVQLASGS